MEQELEYPDEHHEHSPHDDICERCECCSTYWEDCTSCGGEGGRGWEDLYFEDPLWYSPDDFIHCDDCDGEGGWLRCMGDCDEHGHHA